MFLCKIYTNKQQLTNWPSRRKTVRAPVFAGQFALKQKQFLQSYGEIYNLKLYYERLFSEYPDVMTLLKLGHIQIRASVSWIHVVN